MRKLVFVEMSPLPKIRNKSMSPSPIDNSLSLQVDPEPYSNLKQVSFISNQKPFTKGMDLAAKLYGFNPSRKNPKSSTTEAKKPAAVPSGNLRSALRRNTFRRASHMQHQSHGCVLQDMLDKSRKSKPIQIDEDSVRRAKVIELLNYHKDRMKRIANSPKRIREKLDEIKNMKSTPVKVRSKSTQPIYKMLKLPPI